MCLSGCLSRSSSRDTLYDSFSQDWVSAVLSRDGGFRKFLALALLGVARMAMMMLLLLKLVQSGSDQFGSEHSAAKSLLPGKIGSPRQKVPELVSPT